MRRDSKQRIDLIYKVARRRHPVRLFRGVEQEIETRGREVCEVVCSIHTSPTIFIVEER